MASFSDTIEPSQPAQDLRSGRKLHLLAVDDEITIRYVIGELLQEGGHDVATAADGLEALEVIEAGRPDVVLTDLIMPRMNGIELARHVKERYPEVPVILVTGSGREAPAGIFDAIVNKPFTHATLWEAIDHSLARGAREAGTRPA